MNESPRISSDYVSDVLDEIALEGLDGITTEALWMRLSVRPNFCFQIDSNSKNFIWKIVIQLANISFYEIPKARATIKHYNPSVSDDNSKATLELDEIYPYHKVKNASGVLGSCEHYHTRVDVTDDVNKMNLEEVEKKWGNTLVIVASQEIRIQSLLGDYSSPNLDFSKCTVHYDILERIGRSRYLGLATCGKGSIQSVVEDSKSIFHYLKLLFHHKLIKKQNFSGSLQVCPNASKVYLTRFFEECLNDNMAILQIAIDELKTRPNYSMPSNEFNELFDSRKRSRLKKFRKSNIFKKFISISKSLPYRTFFPDANQSEWERKCKGGERSVRCVRLINPNVELADIFEKECEIEDEESPLGFLPKGVFFENMSILSQAYYHIKNSGSLGMSQNELVQKMGLNKKFVRNLIKRLTSENLCQFYIENEGRRRSKRCIVGENIQTKAAATELVQILSDAMPTILPTSEKPSEEKTEKNSETINSTEKLNLPQLQEENMSYRTLRRMGMIIKLIKANRFRLFHQITNYINEEEIKEGVTSRVDRVTVKRLLQKLEKDQLIKKFNLTGPDKSGHIVKVYTDPTFEPDPKQMDTLYHAHSPYTSTESVLSMGDYQTSLVSDFSPFLLENLAEVKKMMNGIDQKFDQKFGQPLTKKNELVYSPKFIRLHILHELVFYLVYDYTGILDKNQKEIMKELSKVTAIDENLNEEMPTLYSTQVSSYMFVPPLSHSGKLPGWFLISDILIRMPLSVIIKMFRICETCPDLWKYLHHPIRKHFLVKDLPHTVRQILFSRKNQMSYFYNEFKRLCFMGLLQYGPKVGREHYQTFAYLNRKASLLDTSTSPPAYYQVPADMKFEVKKYNFETKNDITNYWMDLFNICIGTNLGVKSNMCGKEILFEKEFGKESLKKFLEPKSMTQAAEDDNGTLPGDNLGAGGLDSVMFSFLRSNWTGPVNRPVDDLKKTKPVKVPLQKIKREQGKKSLLLKAARRRREIVRTEKINNILELEEKPKIAKYRKIRERECLFKKRRKTSYDEIDLEALKLMNTLRVTWSTAEDNLLLICRVAMMFLCPNSRTFVKIPWSEVRKVLQKNLPESKNKTQKAIARRIIYMLKNPTTVRSVNLCLEELKEMPEAIEKFDCLDLLSSIKPSSPNLSELQSRLYEKFHELVSFLKDRFIESSNLKVKTDKDLIPDSLTELFEKYEFKDEFEHPLTVKTIRENVIRATFMSSLSCRADKTSSAVQLFDIYRQYNEDELRSAIKKLHNDKVITLAKKIGNAIFKSGKVLPLSFTPYKLSFAFQNMLNMRYTHAIYPDSFSQMNKLVENVDGEFEVDLNECNITLFLLASKGFVTFEVTIPDQIIALDSGNFTDATYSKMLERYCEMLQFSGSNSKVVCSSGKIILRSDDDEAMKALKEKKEMNEDSVESEKEHDEDEEDVVDAKKMKLDANEKEKIEKEKKENVSENDGTVENFDKSEVELKSNEKEPSSNKMTRSSRVILYMMREEAKKEANNDSGKKAQEFCVVNASKVIGKMDKEKLESYSNERGPKAAAIIVKDVLNRSLVPMNLVDEDALVKELDGVEEMKGAKTVLDFISSKKEIGATVKELNSNFRELNLSSVMKRLIDSKIIIKTGITERRFVSQKHSTPWLLNSFKMTRLEREKVKPPEVTAITLVKSTENGTDEEEIPKKKFKGTVSLDEIKNESYTHPHCSNNKIKVIIRPWIRIDGSLNRRVLDRFLGTILAYIMTNPGISVQNIMDKFSPCITPVWTKDLIEILFDIGCLTLTSVVATEKSTLFSKSTVEISDCDMEMVEDCFVAVEAKVDAVTTLGLFIGKTTYSKDFLVD